jgi:formylglycine-generating enzyme required for sulfatase activity
LCGKGSTAADTVDPTTGAWYAACSAAARKPFPYGDTPQPGACNEVTGGGARAAVGSFPRCAGGYPGLLDMSGNVAEWEDACVDDSDQGSCSVRGGAFDTAPERTACLARALFSRTSSSGDVGFRCCSP